MSWPEYALDEIGSVSRGRSRHRPRDAAHLYGGEYPFIQTGDVKHAGLYLTEFEQTYSEDGLAQSKLWPEGTLCITIAANIADTSILKIDACFPDSVIGFIPDPNKSDARFVKYLFDAALKKKFKAFTQGAAQDNLSQGKLLSLKFPIPELIIQRRIANILSTYDDLIENNRRRIALLEYAARQLYKEWFVRFRFPGHEHVKIIDGVPEGWKMKTLGDVANTNEASHKAKELPASINYIDISSVTQGGVDQKTTMLSDEAPGRARRIANHGDIIWSNVRPNLKAYALVMEPEESDVFSTGFTVLTAKTVPHLFLYQFVTTENFVSHLVNHATGSSYPAVRPPDFEKAELLLPPNSLLSQYQEICEPSYALISKLVAQNRSLAEARDLLLPKLMSGEIAA